MSINLVTYANQTVTPTNDAIIYERAIDQNGIFYGCNVTVSGNEVHITGGYGMVCGREFTIESEAIAVTLAPSGTLDGRLYVRLDLADADAPIQLLTATGNTLPPLEQDSDVNYTNGTWEMELATFTVGVSALSDCVETYETIMGGKTDYIVEQGTSGVWTYRKWASGIAECWGTTSATVTLTTVGTYYHRGQASFSLPSGLFNASPSVVMECRNGYWSGLQSVSTTSVSAYFFDVANATGYNLSIEVSAKGTWK